MREEELKGPAAFGVRRLAAGGWTLYGSTIEPTDVIGRAELYPAAAGLVRAAAPRGRAEARPYR